MTSTHREHAYLEQQIALYRSSGVNCLTIAAGMKSIVRIALVVVLGLLNGCGSAPVLPPLTGTWAFTLTPTGSPSDVIQATVALTQLGNSVFGPVTLTGNGAACGATAMMSGTVNGVALSLQLTQSQSTLTITGKATGGYPLTSYASGKYTASSGPCLQNGGTGTWSAFLESNNSSSFDEKPH